MCHFIPSFGDLQWPFVPCMEASAHIYFTFWDYINKTIIDENNLHRYSCKTITEDETAGWFMLLFGNRNFYDSKC